MLDMLSIWQAYWIFTFHFFANILEIYVLKYTETFSINNTETTQKFSVHLLQCTTHISELGI